MTYRSVQIQLTERKNFRPEAVSRRKSPHCSILLLSARSSGYPRAAHERLSVIGPSFMRDTTGNYKGMTGSVVGTIMMEDDNRFVETDSAQTRLRKIGLGGGPLHS